MLTLGTAKAWRLIGRMRPAVVVGFGGYPTRAAADGGKLRGVPSVLHEQNGVMGRANRVAGLARHRDRHQLSASSRASIRALQGKITFTGNPVRPQVIAAAATPYAAPDGKNCGCWCSAAARARA